MKALDVAKTIINYAHEIEKPISNLKLQKIMYFIHRDFLGEFDRKLIDDLNFEAWHYGPAIPRVHRAFNINGAEPIPKQDFNKSNELSDKEREFIEEKVRFYANKKPWDLVALSHEEGGAWDKTYDPNEAKVIPEDLIQEEANATRD